MFFFQKKKKMAGIRQQKLILFSSLPENIKGLQVWYERENKKVKWQMEVDVKQSNELKEW